MIERRSAAVVCVSLFLLGLASGCASIPDAPPPVAIEILPNADRAALGPAPFGSHEPSGWIWAPPPPAIPLPAPRLAWWPARPRQASAVALRVTQPAGPPLEDLQVRFAGRTVLLARDESGWLGLGGLPLDSAGFFGLEIEFRRGSTTETVGHLVPVRPRTYPSTRIRISAGGRSDPEVDARIAREREQIAGALESSIPTWIPEQPFGWPRSPVVKTSPFGQRRVFNGSVRSRHMGLDLRARMGHPIMAPAAGRVALAGSFFYQGNAVYLDHGLGLFTAYFHMSRLDVEMGDLVEPGQVLGRSGSTGRSTAAHLHWSAYVNGQTVDPESLVGLSLRLEPTESAEVDRGG